MFSNSQRALRASCWVASVVLHVVVGGALTVAAQRSPGAASPRVARDARIWIARAEAGDPFPRHVEPSREVELPEVEEPEVTALPDVDAVPPEPVDEPHAHTPDPQPLAEAANAWTTGWNRPFPRAGSRPEREREAVDPGLDPIVAAAPPTPRAPSAAPASTPAAEHAPAREDVLLHAPPPPYPRGALRLRLQGTVLCRLRVREDGHVEAVDVVESSGHPALDRAAASALLHWRFEPRARTGSGRLREVLHAVTFRIPRG